MSSVFAKSYGMSLGSAGVYQIVYALSQSANTQPALTTMVSNGEIVELGVGIGLALLGWYGVKQGNTMIAAFSIPTSAFLILDAIANIIKRNLGASIPSSFQSVAQVRPVGVTQVRAPPLSTPLPTPLPASVTTTLPASVTTTLLTPSN